MRQGRASLRWGAGRRGALAMAQVACAALLAVAAAAQPGGQRPYGDLGGPSPGPEGGDEVRRLFQQSVTLGVPEKELAALVESGRLAGFTAGETQRVLRLVAGAKLAGLPHTDLLNKLREGLAKGISPDGIQAAMEHKAQSLRRAKGLVDTLIMEGWHAPNYPMAVQMVSDALEAGATASDVLCSVREGRPCGEGLPDVRTAFQTGGGRK